MRLTREERGLLYRLAGRHSDIGFIRSYMLSEYGRAPSREVIAKVQAEVRACAARNANSHVCSVSTLKMADNARKFAGGQA